MLHEYRKKTTIKAEQFDGSAYMMETYHITYDGIGDMYTFRLAHNCLPLKRGWWIVDCGKRTVLGYSFDDWKTMSDKDFHRTYERCD